MQSPIMSYHNESSERSVSKPAEPAVPAYRVVDLTKHYEGQPRPANDRLTFDVHAGEIFGILGENGAGKSTLVRQMINLLAPTSGTVELFGRPLDGSAARRVG